MSSIRDRAKVSNNRLQPKGAVYVAGRVGANVSMKRGQILALVTAATQNTVITFASSGSPTAGSTTFSWYGGTLVVDWNQPIATLQTKLDAIFGAGNTVAAGGALNSANITVTFQRTFEGLAVPAPTQSSTTLDTGSITATQTTTGAKKDTLIPWSGTKVANPSAALSVSATGSGGSWTATVHIITYTWEGGSGGETLAAPATVLALTSGQNIRVAAIVSGSVPSGATALRVYVDGLLASRIALSSGAVPQTDLAGYSGSVDRLPLPTANTAFTATNGAHRAVGVLAVDIQSDIEGQVFRSNTDAPSMAGYPGETTIEYLIGGLGFSQADVVGPATTAQWTDALNQLGARITSGTLAGLDATFAVSPIGGI